MTENGRLLTVKQAANYLACSERTIWSLIGSGQLQSVRLSSKMRRIMLCDLDAYIAKMKEGEDFFAFLDGPNHG